MNAYFRRFILASGLTNLADGIATVAWAWLASLLTRDPILIAAVPIALRLPWFLCAIPAGIVTDRTDRRLLILRMDAVRAVAFLLAGLALWQALPLAPAPQSGISAPALFPPFGPGPFPTFPTFSTEVVEGQNQPRSAKPRCTM